MGKALMLTALFVLGWQSSQADNHDSVPLSRSNSSEQSCADFAGDASHSTVPALESCSDDKKFVRTAVLSAGAVFGFDSNELSTEGRTVLDRLIGELSHFEKIQSIRVTGHTDSSGPAIYNLHLSQLRARYIGGFFKSALPGTVVKTVGMGETDPLASNESRKGRLRNRRVEIEVVAIK